MRELKFRAWDTEEKKMLYLGTIADMVWEGGAIEHFKLMQYTGLKDKNGKEIYEGDIIKNKIGQVAQVEYDELGASFIAWFREDRKFFHNGFLFSEDEVIGNIYENPELLKS